MRTILRYTMATESPAQDLRERVEQVIQLIRPAIKADGGDIELVGVSSEGVVRVRFLGACTDCPSSPMTLRDGIERNLKANVSGVQEVLAVE